MVYQSVMKGAVDLLFLIFYDFIIFRSFAKRTLLWHVYLRDDVFRPK